MALWHHLFLAQSLALEQFLRPLCRTYVPLLRADSVRKDWRPATLGRAYVCKDFRPAIFCRTQVLLSFSCLATSRDFRLAHWRDFLFLCKDSRPATLCRTYLCEDLRPATLCRTYLCKDLRPALRAGLIRKDLRPLYLQDLLSQDLRPAPYGRAQSCGAFRLITCKTGSTLMAAKLNIYAEF